MQGLALSISTDGINYFAQNVIGDALLDAISSISLASRTIYPPNIMLPPPPPPPGGGGSGVTTWEENISIALTGGTLSSFNPQFQSCVQNSGGNFLISLVANNCSAAYTWTENFDYVTVTMFGSNSTPAPQHVWNYKMGMQSLSIQVPLALSASSAGTSYQLTVGTVVATPAGLSANIPSHSVVNQAYGCFSSQVDSATVQSVENIDFTTPIQQKVNPLFGTIADSGVLLGSPTEIVYEYAVGSSPLSFPNKAGMTLGVTGQVTYNGSGYSGEAAPSVGLPAMPVDKHVSFNLADYEFNALYWAFYEAGKLQMDVQPSDLGPSSAMLNTLYYQTTIQALYNAYPSDPMTVKVTETAAPTVTFEQLYCLDSAALTQLTNEAVPSSVMTPLSKYLKGQIFLAESAFAQKVQQHASQSGPYLTRIESAAATHGVVMTHDVNCVFNVVPSSTEVPVFTVQFNETEILTNLRLGLSPSSGTPSSQKQTVQFDFALFPTATKATFVSSNISGITSGTFPEIWNFGLQPAYVKTMAQMGQAGVPVPFIKGFQYLFDEAAVQVQSGFVNVVSDVIYKQSS